MGKDYLTISIRWLVCCRSVWLHCYVFSVSSRSAVLAYWYWVKELLILRAFFSSLTFFVTFVWPVFSFDWLKLVCLIPPPFLFLLMRAAILKLLPAYCDNSHPFLVLIPDISLDNNCLSGFFLLKLETVDQKVICYIRSYDRVNMQWIVFCQEVPL